MVYSCQYPVVIFIYISVGLPVIRSIPRKYPIVSPIPLVSYLSVKDLGGVGASRGEGIGDNILLCLGRGGGGGG